VGHVAPGAVVDELTARIAADNRSDRSQALLALAEAGERDTDCIPTILSAITKAGSGSFDEGFSRAELGVIDRLTACRPGALRLVDEELAETLSHRVLGAQEDAVQVVNGVGRREPTAVAPFLDSLVAVADSESAAAADAAWGLVQVAHAEPDVVRSFVAQHVWTLDRDDPDAVSDAATVVGTVGWVLPEHVAGVDRLVASLDDPDPGVRTATVEALGRIGGRPVRFDEPAGRPAIERVERAVPRLVSLLDDPNPDVRDQAAMSLRPLARESRSVARHGLSGLVDAVDDPDVTVRRAALVSLPVVVDQIADGRLLARTLDALYGLVADAESEVRELAVRTVGEFDLAAALEAVSDPVLGQLVDAVFECCGAPEDDLRTSAVDVWAGFDPEVRALAAATDALGGPEPVGSSPFDGPPSAVADAVVTRTTDDDAEPVDLDGIVEPDAESGDPDTWDVAATVDALRAVAQFDDEHAATAVEYFGAVLSELDGRGELDGDESSGMRDIVAEALEGRESDSSSGNEGRILDALVAVGRERAAVERPVLDTLGTHLCRTDSGTAATLTAITELCEARPSTVHDAARAVLRYAVDRLNDEAGVTPVWKYQAPTVDDLGLPADYDPEETDADADQEAEESAEPDWATDARIALDGILALTDVDPAACTAVIEPLQTLVGTPNLPGRARVAHAVRRLAVETGVDLDTEALNDVLAASEPTPTVQAHVATALGVRAATAARHRHAVGRVRELIADHEVTDATTGMAAITEASGQAPTNALGTLVAASHPERDRALAACGAVDSRWLPVVGGALSGPLERETVLISDRFDRRRERADALHRVVETAPHLGTAVGHVLDRQLATADRTVLESVAAAVDDSSTTESRSTLEVLALHPRSDVRATATAARDREGGGSAPRERSRPDQETGVGADVTTAPDTTAADADTVDADPLAAEAVDALAATLLDGDDGELLDGGGGEASTAVEQCEPSPQAPHLRERVVTHVLAIAATDPGDGSTPIGSRERDREPPAVRAALEHLAPGDADASEGSVIGCIRRFFAAESPSVRAGALAAAGRFHDSGAGTERSASRTLEAMEPMLRDDAAVVREQAIRSVPPCLGDGADVAPTVVDAVGESLAGPPPASRAACHALGWMGTATPAVRQRCVSHLEDALAAGSRSVRREAVDAIARLARHDGSVARTVADPLLERLEHDTALEGAIGRALRAVPAEATGSPRRSAAGVLAALETATDGESRRGLGEFLESLASEHPGAVGRAIATLDSDYEVTLEDDDGVYLLRALAVVARTDPSVSLPACVPADDVSETTTDGVLSDSSLQRAGATVLARTGTALHVDELPTHRDEGLDDVALFFARCRTDETRRTAIWRVLDGDVPVAEVARRLRECDDHDQPWIRRNVLTGLAALLGLPTVDDTAVERAWVTPLIDACQADHWTVRSPAVTGVTVAGWTNAIAPEEALAHLCGRLTDSTAAVQRRAGAGVAKLAERTTVGIEGGTTLLVAHVDAAADVGGIAGLAELGRRHPAVRSRCVSALVESLDADAPRSDQKAVDALESIAEVDPDVADVDEYLG